MFGLDMLDVAIGIVVIYLLLSLAGTALTEIIESKLKYRAKDLEKGIQELLQQKASGTGTLVEEFYNHPLIAALYPGGYQHKGEDLPSYIPAQTFALAMIDIAKKLPANDKVKKIVEQFTAAASQDVDKTREYLERWFDGTMDRVSGWFKRRTHERLVIIGAIMAITLNVDSIYIARHLMTTRSRERRS